MNQLYSKKANQKQESVFYQLKTPVLLGVTPNTCNKNKNKMKKFAVLFTLLIFTAGIGYTQVDTDYQKPPKEILQLADAPATPSILQDSKAETIILLHRDKYKSIAELSEPELRLAGLRINPATNIGSRTSYASNISIIRTGENDEIPVQGLPAQKRLANFSWSPDETKVAFTNTTSTGVELWVLDVSLASCRKITEPVLNANIGRPFYWTKNSEHLLAKMIPEDREPLIDKTEAIPSGPRISVSDGRKAQNRTYQDLLKDQADEFNFEQLARSDIYKVSLTGNKTLWAGTQMYTRLDISPNGEYVLVSYLEKPFSYLVTYYRFPSKTWVYNSNGNEVQMIEESPLTEVMPQGFNAVEKGKRNINWRTDKPATVYFAQALDDGDPAVEADFRDEIFELEAPFNGSPKTLVKTQQRLDNIYWGNDNIAIVTDRWWSTRNAKTYLFNPSDPQQKPEVVFDVNYQDNYNDPGRFVSEKNEWNENILVIDKNQLFLTGRGYSPEGIRPFFRKLNLKTKKTEELWRADGKETLEQIAAVPDAKKGILLTRVESQTLVPNYFIRNTIKRIAPQQVTFFENPFQSLQEVYKEVITYKRDDGVELSGTLYLPAGYNREKKEKLPMLLWAYPREYKDVASASQVTTSPHTFTAPNYGSPVFWVTRGFAILDDASFPIIGEGEEEPNDSFREQLVTNAKAAIDAVDKLGYIDRERVAAGGHSYGAFMTANLLSHSTLFAAGIARSGAYNRTLTPFGFQSEERTYWEAPDVYYNMSPFMHANKMKTPLLLIHGEADNNSGTFPMQSERYFNALKGMGAPVRLVFLPKESHGYAARESILHMLWEQDQWLEKWVKNKELEPKSEAQN